jgi:hypothetical protein
MIIFKALKMTIAVILGVVYFPLNKAANWLGAEMMKSWKKDKVLFVLYGILFIPCWIISAIFSIPYEAMVESAH